MTPKYPKVSKGMKVMNEVLGGRFGPLPDFFKNRSKPSAIKKAIAKYNKSK